MTVDFVQPKKVDHLFHSGTLPIPNIPKNPEGLRARIMVALMAFFLTFLTLFRSVASHVTRKLPDTLANKDQNITEPTFDSTNKEECRPPSPTSPFAGADLLPTVLKKLAELEEKVDTLQSKPSEMPYEKAELLNAAVCRVDALEAELIATKKVWMLYLICGKTGNSKSQLHVFDFHRLH